VGAPPNNQANFVALVPSAPADRDFNVTTMVPRMNLAEDDTRDLIRLLYVFKDIIDLSLDRVDRFTDIIDFDRCPANFLDLILQDLGYPFSFDLVEIDKRRLCSLLVTMYKQKGTNQGFRNAVRFFLGYEAEYLWPDLSKLYGGWILGVSLLGVDTVLGDHYYYDASIHGPDVGGLTSSFEMYAKIGKGSALTTDENTRAAALAEYMKPVNMRIAGVLAVLAPPASPAAVAGSGQITVSWSAVAGATGYRLFWSKTPIVNALAPDGIADPDNASPYVMTVPSGETRWIVVAARDGSGINGVGSAIVSATAS
jgi:phage tail-like protein